MATHDDLTGRWLRPALRARSFRRTRSAIRRSSGSPRRGPTRSRASIAKHGGIHFPEDKKQRSHASLRSCCGASSRRGRSAPTSRSSSRTRRRRWPRRARSSTRPATSTCCATTCGAPASRSTSSVAGVGDSWSSCRLPIARHHRVRAQTASDAAMCVRWNSPIVVSCGRADRLPSMDVSRAGHPGHLRVCNRTDAAAV
jgi:hypothetical protein